DLHRGGRPAQLALLQDRVPVIELGHPSPPAGDGAGDPLGLARDVVELADEGVAEADEIEARRASHRSAVVARVAATVDVIGGAIEEGVEPGPVPGGEDDYVGRDPATA